MNQNEVAVFTPRITNATFTIPAGARTIDLNNTGAAAGSFSGNASKGGESSVFVTIAIGQAYSFGDVEKPYPAIEIDATGTIIEIVANY